ncbi:MAG: hypothetical protein K2P78_06765, partial [Gemmataceae bacterium]|nr:hypothetical protein [Gemmataceae bacterium]
MAAYVVCSCCGTKIRTTPADVGRAVVCPVSRRIVLVNAEDVRHAPDAPARRPRRRWAVVLLLLVLFLAGLGGFVAWDQLGRPGLDRETADARPGEKPADAAGGTKPGPAAPAK